MSILRLNKELLELYGGFSSSSNTSWKIRLRHQILVLIMFVCLLFGWSSSVVFIIMYQKTDIRDALYAVFQVAGEFSANFSVLVACMYPKSIENIFIKLNDVRENGKFAWFIENASLQKQPIEMVLIATTFVFVSKCSSYW